MTRKSKVFDKIKTAIKNGGFVSAIAVGVVLAVGSAVAADAVAPKPGNANAMCALIEKMYDVFKKLRVLAFLGAGFIIAKYGWEFITTNKVNNQEGVAGLKSVGVPLLIGFVLLFSVNIILNFLMDSNAIDCADKFMKWK